MRAVLLALVLFGLCAKAAADALVDVPDRWVGRVVAVPQQRMVELEPADVARIRETRHRLGEMLMDGAEGPAIADAYGRLGALYLAHRLYAGAELAFHNARALDPLGFEWAYYAADIALRQGEPKKALELLDRVAEIEPAYPTLLLRRGEAQLSLNNLEQARADYRQLVADADRRAAALYGLAQIDVLQRNWEAAAEKLYEVLALQPDADALRYPLGQALIQLGRRDEAREHLARRGVVKPVYPDPLIDGLRSLQSGARHHYQAAIDAVERGDRASAAESFVRGLAEDPGNPRARTSYARVLWILGRQQQSETELRRAIADGPEESLPRFLLAILDDAAGRAAQAVAGYRQVLAIDPGHGGALSYLARLYLREGDYDNAVEFFERALDAGVSQMPLFLHYWAALLHAGTPDAELRDRLIAFDRRFPEPPVFRLLLAKLLLGSTEQGVTDIGAALEIAGALHAMSPNPAHTELLAFASAASGDFERARELQEGLLETAVAFGAWTRVAGLEARVASYRAGRLPESPWPPEDLVLLPAAAEPDLPMRNYPAGQAY